MHAMVHRKRSEGNSQESSFLLSLSILGLDLGSKGLAANTLTHKAMSPAQKSEMIFC